MLIFRVKVEKRLTSKNNLPRRHSLFQGQLFKNTHAHLPFTPISQIVQERMIGWVSEELLPEMCGEIVCERVAVIDIVMETGLTEDDLPAFALWLQLQPRNQVNNKELVTEYNASVDTSLHVSFNSIHCL